MKTLAFAGIRAAEIALIVKLLAAGRPVMSATWTIGEEGETPDLVIVDLAEFSGRVARVRALDEGVHFAVLAEPGADVIDAPLVLRRPLTALALLAVLSQAASVPAPPRRDRADFALLLGNVALPERAVAETVELFDRTGDPDARAMRASFMTPRRQRDGTDFDALLKRGPLCVQRAGMPELALDPVGEVFYADAPLSALESYFTDRITGRECRPLASLKLAELRDGGSGQSLMRLRWQHALLRSNGCLGAHLDPGGSYRVSRWLSLDGDYRKPFRIAASMLRLAPLNRIAAKSGASLDEVVDVVNAYDALGWLEWRPRRSRHAAAEKGRSASSSAYT